MPGFRRVFRQFPGNAVISEIESVDIIDAPPPGVPLGAGTGTCLIVGEFERGAVNQPVQIFSAADMTAKLGNLGFPSAVSQYDGAVARRSGGNELWNGNGFIYTRNKRFNRMVVCRVDNRAGDVEFRRLACLTGGAGPFTANSNDSINFLLDGGPTSAIATVIGSQAQIDASGASYPATLTNLTLEIVVDQDVSRLVKFTTETLLTEVIATINAVMAQDIASDNAGQLRLSSVIAGANGYIQVVGGDARAVLGFPTAVTQQVDTYTVANASNGTYILRVTTSVNGQLVNFDTEGFTRTTETTTQLRDAILIQLENLAVPGVGFAAGAGDTIVATGDDNIVFASTVQSEGTPGDITIVMTTPPVVNATFGNGNVGNLASFSAQEMATIIDAQPNISSNVDTDGNLRTCNTATPGTGTLAASGGALASVLGYTVGEVSDASDAEDVVIPAGTIVEGTSPATRWVTLEDIETGTEGGPWTVGVRPWEDTDTAQANTTGQITTIVSELPDGFSVTNPNTVTRLSASQIDAAYARALDATLDLSTPASDADFVVASRASASIMRRLRENAESATANGLAPRKCLVRPLLGTSITDALANSGTGVAADRNDRRQYCFPGVTTQVTEIQAVGARAVAWASTTTGSSRLARMASSPRRSRCCLPRRTSVSGSRTRTQGRPVS